MDNEERLAVFIDYENLALGAREHLGATTFDFQPIADALAARGRVVVRRAYADWSYFDEDRRNLTRQQVDLIEMPQRMGASRKNAADIKMVVDAIEMAFERDYISTFVMCTGDSDFSPLVHKLRELNKRVIGVGVEKSTSRLLPSACDEFLFYDRLEGVEDRSDENPAPRSGRGRGGKRTTKADDAASGTKETTTTRRGRGGKKAEPAPEPEAPAAQAEPAVDVDVEVEEDDLQPVDEPTMEVRVAQTLADLLATTNGPVTASLLKRTLVRKDPTFSEAEYGFRTFGEFVRYLSDRGVIELSEGPSKGDPWVTLPEHGDEPQAFALVRRVVEQEGGTVPLSGLKNALRKEQPSFSEKTLGYRGFLQFCKAAQTAGAVTLRWDEDADDYLVTAA